MIVANKCFLNLVQFVMFYELFFFKQIVAFEWYIWSSRFVSSKVSELQRLGLSEVAFLVFEGRGSWDEINSHWTTIVETNINIYIYVYMYICIYVLVYVHIHFVIYTCLRSLQKPSRVNQVM